MLITFYEKPGCGGNSRQKNALVGLGHILDVKNLLAEKWERGELRKYFGNKQLSDWFNMTAPAIKDGIVKPADLDEDGALNTRPRKALNWLTALEKFAQLVDYHKAFETVAPHV